MSEQTPRQIIFSGMADSHVGFSRWLRFHFKPRGLEAQAFAQALRFDPQFPRDILFRSQLDRHLQARRPTLATRRIAAQVWHRYEQAQSRATAAARSSRGADGS